MSTDNIAFYKSSRMKFFTGSMLLIPVVDQFTKAAAQNTVDSPFSLVAIDVVPPLAVFGPIAVLTAIWAFILVRRLGKNWLLLAVPMSLIVGGALSNVGEAAVRGVVTDFIRIGPVATNVADLAMAVGVLSLLFMAPYIARLMRNAADDRQPVLSINNAIGPLQADINRGETCPSDAGARRRRSRWGL